MNDFPRLEIDTRELVAEVQRLLEEARNLEEDFGAVNWGDLGVVDVEYTLSMLHPEDGPLCVVTVEEASPDCELARWLNANLDAHRFERVLIKCEW